MANHLPMPPYDELSRHLSYDPFTGLGTWLISPCNRVQVGQCAGSLNSTGYIHIRHKTQRYLAHRLFWFLQTEHDPKELTVDHIDGNKLNNKFSNLRLATQAQQQQNRSKPVNNTSGHRGVCWDKQTQKYLVHIRFNKKSLTVGRYKTFEEAVAARQAKELELFGEFSPLHRLNNDKFFLDHDEQQLSVFWRPSFRGRPADREGPGQQHADSTGVPGAAGLC